MLGVRDCVFLVHAQRSDELLAAAFFSAYCHGCSYRLRCRWGRITRLLLRKDGGTRKEELGALCLEERLGCSGALIVGFVVPRRTIKEVGRSD